MAKRRSKTPVKRPLRSQRRAGLSFAEVMSSANRRAHEEANRRSGKRELKSVRAAIAATDMDDGGERLALLDRMIRWLVGLVLLPLCWVTTWTFLSRFSHAALEQGFWQTAEFWYFAIGGLWMTGWFWAGLGQRFFLYVYVLGHELTHAVFVVLFRGKVTEFHVSSDGGYITTNKTNMVISLSPYFVPFWAVIAAGLYAVLRLSLDLSAQWELAFYAVMGVTWTFHMVWTLWMIPRDQPDLKENGTFLSLVVIYLANLLVLVGLLCVAEEAPLRNTREFGMEWLRHAATWSDMALRWAAQMYYEIRAAARI
jgi:hypothetical protein